MQPPNIKELQERELCKLLAKVKANPTRTNIAEFANLLRATDFNDMHTFRNQFADFLDTNVKIYPEDGGFTLVINKG